MINIKQTLVYQIKVWIQGISPMVWRRLLVRSDSTIEDLHYTIQIAIGWNDIHLNRFHILGQGYGVYHDDGISFPNDPEKVYLSSFDFRIHERFLYEYDFGDAWLHEVRVEKRLPLDFKRIYPVCIEGKHAATPRKTAVEHWLICRCETSSNTKYCLAAMGLMTILMTIRRMNGCKRIGQLTQTSFVAVRSTPVCGNTRRVTATGCFHIERRSHEIHHSIDHTR